MRDQHSDGAGSGGTAVDVGLPSAGDLTAWVARLGGSEVTLTDAERIDLLRGLEVLKGAAEGAQSALAAGFDASQRAEQSRAGVRAERQGRGVAAQVALARRESPHRGSIHVGLAKVLRAEMPCTLAALRAGRITERKAMLLARETACLELPSRARIDGELCGDPEKVERMGERELAGAARTLAYRLEPRAYVERRRKAESERHTRLRAAPDTMSVFTALLTVRNGVALHAVLGREADRLRSAGDQRTRGQLMADLLVQRVTSPFVVRPTAGETASEDPGPPTSASLAIMVNLVVPDAVLLGDSDDGGWVDGYGPVPGDLLREWIADNLERDAESDSDDVSVWLRRIYETPRTGDLVAMDSRARHFAGALADYLRIRDRACRTPWCDAPVRHLDHVEEHAAGGPTSAANAQGPCEACNHAKQAFGWSARPRPGPRHTVETTTPTGHTYASTTGRLNAAIWHRADHVELVFELAG